MVVVTLAGLMLIMLFYCLTILIRGRLNPIVFLKKYLPEMKNTFVQGSGIASIPDTIRCCQLDFGISPKVYSFAIPFGATVNLDGNCIYLSIAGLFLARMCGIELFSTEVVSMVFAIIILSIGAPITPGSALLCLFVLLTQMGVSLDMTILVMGVNFFIEMFLAMTNTMGDVAISLTVARSENLVDLKTYYK
jgi:Na+/H+-dicarboxylate symporter